MKSDEATRWALFARAGDAAAIVRLVEFTQADVWRFCAHLAGRAAADDLTQETFARAVRSLGRFRGDSTAITWLLSIARRVAADAVRADVRRERLARRLGALAVIDRAAGDRIDDDPGDSVAIADLVHHLREERRTAFVLTQMLGYSYADAAAICHCPVGTIRSRVARARADLIRGLDVADSAASPPQETPDDRDAAESYEPPAR